MPRYFFNVHDGQNLDDPEGMELPDFQAVRGEALRTAGEILRDIDGALAGEKWVMDVNDESDRRVLTLEFSATEYPD